MPDQVEKLTHCLGLLSNPDFYILLLFGFLQAKLQVGKRYVRNPCKGPADALKYGCSDQLRTGPDTGALCFSFEPF